MSKEALAIVIDANMDEKGLDMARRAVRLMLQRKFAAGSTRDEVAVVVCGAPTDNPLADSLGGYENVSVAAPIATPTLALNAVLDEIEAGGDSPADISDAVVVAMSVIQERVKKLKFQRRVYVLTDGSSAIDPDNASQIDTIAGGLVSHDVKLNVLGIGWSDGDDSDSSGSDSDDDDESEPPAPPSQTEVLLRQLAAAAGGAVLPISGALALLSQMSSRAVRQVTCFRGPLVFQASDDEQLSFNVHAFVKSSQDQVAMRTKRASALSANAGGVATETQHFNKLRPEGDDLLDPADVVSALSYGSSRVTGYDAAVLKSETEKALTILGFPRASSVPRHHSMGGVDCIVAEPGSSRSALALSALVHALHEKERVGLARFVKRKNAPPLLVALFPHISRKEECLYAVQLPFSEDIRDYQFAPFATNPGLQPSAAQSAAARALIEAMDLQAVPDEDGDPYEALRPEQSFNPVFQRFFHNVDRRAADPYAELVPLDTLARPVHPGADASLAAFKEAFPLEERKKDEAGAGRKRRRHWRHYLADGGAGDPAAAAAGAAAGAAAAGGVDGAPLDVDALLGAKRRRGDEAAAAAAAAASSSSGAVKVEDLARRDVDAVGSADPVGDFTSMLARRDDPAVVGRAIDGLTSVVKAIVRRSMGSSLLGKAASCVAALRKGCVEQEEAEKYNAALDSLRLAFAESKPAFWDLLRDAPCPPISSDECAESSVSPAEAAAYFAPAREEPPESGTLVSAAGEDDDDDDLFGGME